MADKEYLYKIDGMYECDGVLYLPSTPADHLEKIKNFEFQEGDVVVDTFSKSGTTWTQEILYLLHNGVNTEEAASKPIKQRVPFIDFNGMWAKVNSLKPPRIYKSHLRSDFFQKALDEGKAKFVITMRNPKDTLVSFYHFYQQNMAFGNYKGSWNDFFEIIRNDQLIYGDWFDYTLSWWKLRNHPNVLFLKYEDMKLDPATNIQKIADFCKIPLSEEQLKTVVEHTTFDKMQKNSSVNYSNDYFLTKGTSFMRKGSTGGWVNYFTEAQSRYIDELYEEKLKNQGLTFTFE